MGVDCRTRAGRFNKNSNYQKERRDEKGSNDGNDQVKYPFNKLVVPTGKIILDG